MLLAIFLAVLVAPVAVGAWVAWWLGAETLSAGAPATHTGQRHIL